MKVVKLTSSLSLQIAALIVMLSGCTAVNNQKLTQFSTVNALLEGIYDGNLTLDKMLHYGNFGLGTFNSLNGEMIVLDGKVYQIPADGIVKIPEGSKMKTPFATVTFFSADSTYPLESGLNYNQITDTIDTVISSKNLFYAIKITGTFTFVKTRSVPKQTKPYRLLNEVIDQQTFFEFKDIKGILVGFRSPDYISGINIPGYHFHFITADKTAGGHLLEFVISEATMEIDEMHEFSLLLPDNKSFYDANLSEYSIETLEKVEKYSGN